MSAELDCTISRKITGIPLCIETSRISEETSYDLGEFHLYMGGGFYELEDKICFTQFRPESMNDNAELWELDTHTGQKADRAMV